MKRPARSGDIGRLEFVVTEEHAIDFSGDAMPAVLSTPWLIWFLEHAAREAMLPLLDAGESTVGVRVDVAHLAATPLGQKVRCVARVLSAEKGRIHFQVEARDESELIARGTHQLQIIDQARFRARVQRKANAMASKG